jgi:hypothetical protein
MSNYYLIDTNVLLAASGMATHFSHTQSATVSGGCHSSGTTRMPSFSLTRKAHPGLPKRG